MWQPSGSKGSQGVRRRRTKKEAAELTKKILLTRRSAKEKSPAGLFYNSLMRYNCNTRVTCRRAGIARHKINGAMMFSGNDIGVNGYKICTL